MKLDRHTYEAWLLDRAEGNLSTEQGRQLDAFLQANPDIDAPNVVLPRLETAAETFNAKESLLRTFPPAGAPDAARLNDFLAARLEGDLEAEQEKQLGHYLYEHPEAAADAEGMGKAKVVAAPISFDGKPKLERHFPPHGLPGTHNLTDFLIADAEGDLTSDQRTALERHLLHHPAGIREQRLVAAARIQPEPLVFPRKQDLRKRKVNILPLWTRWATAASVALLMGMGWWYFQKDQSVDAGIALNVHPIAPVPLASTLPDTAAEAAPHTPGQAVAELPEPVKPTSVNVPEKQLQHKPEHVTAPVTVPPTKEQLEERTEPETPAQPLQQPIPEEAPEPALAQQPETPGQEEQADPIIAPASEPMAMASASEGQSLGLFLANTVRGEMLDAPKRPAGLDGNDLLAMAGRAIGALSSGQGGVQVRRSTNGERIRLSLGRNFSISASRGR